MNPGVLLLIALGLLAVGFAGKQMLAVDAIKKLIEEKEGRRYRMYRDERGLPTIGVGHLIKPSEPYLMTATLNDTQVDALFTTDFNEAADAIAKYVRVPLNENQRAALVSLVFNIGIDAFRNSTLFRLLNAGDYAGAANQFLAWNKVTIDGQKVPSNGLTKRRYAEMQIFNARV